MQHPKTHFIHSNIGCFWVCTLPLLQTTKFWTSNWSAKNGFDNVPWKSADEMYKLIDQIWQGNNPWKTVSFCYQGQVTADSPKWMTESYACVTDYMAQQFAGELPPIWPWNGASIDSSDTLDSDDEGGDDVETIPGPRAETNIWLASRHCTFYSIHTEMHAYLPLQKPNIPPISPSLPPSFISLVFLVLFKCLSMYITILTLPTRCHSTIHLMIQFVFSILWRQNFTHLVIYVEWVGCIEKSSM